MATTHDIRFDAPFAPLAAALGMGRARSGARITSAEVQVRMGRAFRAGIPLGDIRAAEKDERSLLGGWGVHGWAGRWLVNGSGSGIVRIDVSPDCRARVLGVPVRLSSLRMSLADPDAFLADLRRARDLLRR